MAIWGAVAAAAIAAAANIATESMKKGPQTRGASVGGKQPVETIDPFGGKTPGPLMGGLQPTKTEVPLSQSLETPAQTPVTSPAFQPGIQNDDEERRRLAAMFGGIA